MIVSFQVIINSSLFLKELVPNFDQRNDKKSPELQFVLRSEMSLSSLVCTFYVPRVIYDIYNYTIKTSKTLPF